MADDIDYEELADNSISDIKDEVEGRDIDFQKLLEAEKDNKDRKTLKQWLQRRVEDTERYEKEPVEEEPVVESEGGGSLWTRPSTNFILGILVGIAAAALVIGSGGAGGTTGAMSADQVSQQVTSLFQDRIPADANASIDVSSVDSSSYSDVYVVTMSVSAQGQTQEMEAYVTSSSGLMFIQPPVDIETGEQIGSSPLAGGGTQQPQTAQ